VVYRFSPPSFCTAHRFFAFFLSASGPQQASETISQKSDTRPGFCFLPQFVNLPHSTRALDSSQKKAFVFWSSPIVLFFFRPVLSPSDPVSPQRLTIQVPFHSVPFVTFLGGGDPVRPLPHLFSGFFWNQALFKNLPSMPVGENLLTGRRVHPRYCFFVRVLSKSADCPKTFSQFRTSLFFLKRQLRVAGYFGPFLPGGFPVRLPSSHLMIGRLRTDF